MSGIIGGVFLLALANSLFGAVEQIIRSLKRRFSNAH